MRVLVLGTAAGGGFPQWNCGCPNCRGVREGSLRAEPRTETQIAVTADGVAWFLLGASPEIRAQIEGAPPLHARGPRHSPVAGIVLANGDLDHVLGLLCLREAHPLRLHATRAVREGFTEGNALYRTLERFAGQVTWDELRLGEPRSLDLPDGRASGLSVEAVAVPGKLPPHLAGLRAPSPEDTVGLVIREAARGRSLAFFPSVGAPTPALAPALREADLVLFDGTLFADDELISLGVGMQRAAELAHWPLGGAGGSLAFLAELPARRKLLIHVNNTNPVLREGSPERAAVAAAGVEVARDGMEVTL